MSQLRLNNITALSSATASGKVSVFVDTADKRLKSIDDAAAVRVFVDRTSSETLTSKKFDSTVTDVDSTDATKVINRSLSGMTSGVTLTLATSQSTSQTLTYPNITGADTLVTTGLAQSITGQKTFTAPVLGAATATTINGVTITGSGSATLALGSKSLTMSNTLTFAGADGNTITFPSGNDTAVMLTGTQSITGVKTLTNPTTAAGTTGVPSMTVTHGTNLTSAVADAIENDAVAFYNTVDTTNGRRFSDAWNYFRLTGSGSGITGIADFFGTNDGIPLVANGVYEVEWHCYFSLVTAGTATWTIVTATTALATLTGEYVGSNIAGIAAVGAPQTAAINTTASSSTAFPVTGTEATGVTHYFTIRALLTAGNGASNTRLRLTMGTGTATPLINSYFRVRRLPAGNTGTYVA